MEIDTKSVSDAICQKCLMGTGYAMDSIKTDEPKGSVAKPWEFWATISFSFLIFFLFIMTQTVLCVIFALVEIFTTGKHKLTEINLIFKELESNGFFLSVATCLCAIFCISAMSLFIHFRKGINFKEYLGLKRIGGREVLKWTSVLLVFALFQDTLSFVLGKPIVPEVMEIAYKTAYFIPLLFLALTVAAPLFEELFFRGFLFVGIQNSKIGSLGAVLITSVLWAAIHLQYDIYGITQIFLGGLLLSYARIRSGSLYPCIIMHSLMNLVATLEVIIKLKMV